MGFCGWIDLRFALCPGVYFLDLGRGPYSSGLVIPGAPWKVSDVRQARLTGRVRTADSVARQGAGAEMPAADFRLQLPLHAARPASRGMPHFRPYAPRSLQLCPHPLQRVTGELATM